MERKRDALTSLIIMITVCLTIRWHSIIITGIATFSLLLSSPAAAAYRAAFLSKSSLPDKQTTTYQCHRRCARQSRAHDAAPVKTNEGCSNKRAVPVTRQQAHSCQYRGTLRVARAPTSRLLLLLASPSDGDADDTQDTGRQRDDEDSNDRSDGLRRGLLSLAEVGDSNNQIRVGSTVVASTSIPNLQIWQYQSYEVTSIYDQGVDTETGLVDKIYRQHLSSTSQEGDGGESTTTPPPGYTRYVTLYSKKYHEEEGAVTVTPEEIGLVSIRDEVISSVIWALPLFGFWTALALTFASQYNERYGGNFIDAMLRR